MYVCTIITISRQNSRFFLVLQMVDNHLIPQGQIKHLEAKKSALKGPNVTFKWPF